MKYLIAAIIAIAVFTGCYKNPTYQYTLRYTVAVTYLDSFKLDTVVADSRWYSYYDDVHSNPRKWVQLWSDGTLYCEDCFPDVMAINVRKFILMKVDTTAFVY